MKTATLAPLKTPLNIIWLLILPLTDLSLLLQDGFAPPEDEEIDEGAQGDQEEFWSLLHLFITFINLSPPLTLDHYCCDPPLSPLYFVSYNLPLLLHSCLQLSMSMLTCCTAPLPKLLRAKDTKPSVSGLRPSSLAWLTRFTLTCYQMERLHCRASLAC